MSALIQSHDPRRLLRLAVVIDAVGSGAVAAKLVLAAGLLSPLLQLPVGLLRGAGLVLVAYVAWLVWLLRGERLTRGAAGAVIAINLAWTLASFGLLAGDWVRPSPLGVAFVAAQALAVFGFAALQFFALQRLRR